MNRHGLRGFSSPAELTVFAFLGCVIYVQQLLLIPLPNIQFCSTLVVAYTCVYRRKALLPVMVYVFLEGLLNGFGLWWLPYLYLWPLLWAAAMLLPEKLEEKAWGTVIYMVLCSAFGFLFGTLYAPFMALVNGMGSSEMAAWIIQGLPYDIIHGISNFFCGIAVMPVIKLLRILNRRTGFA